MRRSKLLRALKVSNIFIIYRIRSVISATTPELSVLKQQYQFLIMACFLWAGNLGTAWLGSSELWFPVRLQSVVSLGLLEAGGCTSQVVHWHDGHGGAGQRLETSVLRGTTQVSSLHHSWLIPELATPESMVGLTGPSVTWPRGHTLLLSPTLILCERTTQGLQYKEARISKGYPGSCLP